MKNYLTFECQQTLSYCRPIKRLILVHLIRSRVPQLIPYKSGVTSNVLKRGGKEDDEDGSTHVEVLSTTDIGGSKSFECRL